MRNFHVRNLTEGGITAALYVVLTLVSASFGLSSGLFQVRLSEMLTVLPCFFPAAVPGLFIGCVLSNLLTGGAFWDIVFGSLATLLGAVGTRLLRKKRFLSSLPPILFNTLILPPVLSMVYGVEGSFLYIALFIFLGEAVSCGILGQILYMLLRKIRYFHIER